MGGDLGALGVLGTLGDLGALVDLCDLGYLSQIIRGGVLVHLRSSRLPGGGGEDTWKHYLITPYPECFHTNF